MRLPVPRWKSFLASLGLRFRRRSHRAASHSAAGAPTGGFRHSAAGALTGGFRRRRNAIAHPESLEPRRLLAVTTSFVDGALVITGDANDNTLIVSTNQSGELTLQQAGGSPVVIPYALTSNTVSITINAGAGNDTIDLRALDPAVFEVLGQNAITVNGGDGDDVILGGPGNESLTGGAGDDTIDGGLGTDTLTGGTGDDTYQLGEGTGEADTKTIVETLDGDSDTIAYSGDQAPFELQIGSSTVVAGTGYGVFTLTLSGSTAPTLAMNELGYLRIDEASGFAAGSQFDIHQGMVVLKTDAGTSTASNLSITVDQGGDLNVRSTQHLAGLTLENGQVYVSGRSVILTTALSVNEADSILDLGAGAIILDYTGTSPASAIRTDIISGANVTADVWWTGFGITSSRARHSGGLTAVGMMDNYLGGYGPFYEDFLGHPVDTTTIIIRHTYAGDAEINGSIDGTDYALLDNGYIFQTPIDWLNGDFNYDDAIDGTDYSIIDNSLLFQGPTADELPTIELDEDAPPGAIETAHFWSDPLDSPLTFALHSNTNAGLFQSLSIHAITGLVSYTLTANASGTAEIEIAATNAEGLSRVSGPLTIEVAAINDAPTLAATPTLPGGSPLLQLSNGDIYVDLYDPTYGASSYNVTFNVSASDVDIPSGGLTFSLIDAPSGATITATSATTAQISWTVTQAMGVVNGRFRVAVSDGGSPPLSAIQNFYVGSATGLGSGGSPNTAPMAHDNMYHVGVGGGLSVNAAHGLLNNDYDHDSGTFSATVSSGTTANGGAFSVAADGSCTYSAPTGYTGVDSFTYTVSQGATAGMTATAYVYVGGVNLRIDSNNDGEIDVDDESVEDIANTDAHPGKVILVNDATYDRDILPDYADGFNSIPGHALDDLASQSEFVPLLVSLAGVDVSRATLTFAYDASDPAGVELGGDPFLFIPEGTLRIWTKDGDFRRDERGVLAGGHFLAPGTYTLAQLGVTTEQATLTLYVEAIRESAVVADNLIEVDLDADGSGQLVHDQVRVTTVRFELLGRGRYETEFHPVSNVVRSYVDQDDNDPETEEERTTVAYETYKIRIHDPRQTGISAINFAGQSLALTYSNGAYETAEFILPDSDSPASPPQGLTVLTSGATGEVEWSYNPKGKVDFVTPDKLVTAADKRVADLLRHTTNTNYVMGWMPSTTNPGEYGNVIHNSMSIRLTGVDGWLVNVYVDSVSLEIRSIGAPPIGGTAGTTQIDLLKVNSGYKPDPDLGTVFLDRSKVEDLYEIKTSVTGRVDADQRTRLEKVLNAPGESKKIKVASPQYTHKGGKWVLSKKFAVATTVCGLIGMADTAYAWINPGQYDDELEELARVARIAAKERDTTVATTDLLHLQSLFTKYLAHFVPEDTVLNISQLVAARDTIVRLLGEGR